MDAFFFCLPGIRTHTLTGHIRTHTAGVYICIWWRISTYVYSGGIRMYALTGVYLCRQPLCTYVCSLTGIYLRMRRRMDFGTGMDVSRKLSRCNAGDGRARFARLRVRFAHVQVRILRRFAHAHARANSAQKAFIYKVFCLYAKNP